MSRLNTALPRGATLIGVLAVTVLVALSSVGTWRRSISQRDELIGLPVGSSLVKETYDEDAAVGEKIIDKMATQVHSPVWKQLIGSKKMRMALAAAIGAERLQPGGPASAFNLGNLLSGMPHQKRAQVKQQLRLADVPHPHSFAKALSPWQEWERSRGSPRPRRRNFERSWHSKQARAVNHAPSWVPEMPDRLAANGWQQALSPQQALHAVHPKVNRATRNTNTGTAEHHIQYVFDEFAPGVLPGTSSPAPPKVVKKVAAPPPAKPKVHKVSIKEGVEKATGFGDTLVKIGETPEQKLQNEVQHLRAMNAKEKAQFEKREKVDIEHNLVALEKKQLAASQAPARLSPAAAAAKQHAEFKHATEIGLTSSAPDQKVKSVLNKAKGAGKKVLGMLKAAEEQRKAQAIAWVSTFFF